MPSMIPNWNEDLVFEGVNYIMDSSNGTLFDPRTEKKVGWWEANYGYGGPAGCEGYVTWVDHYAKDLHDVDVSRNLAHSLFQEQENAAIMIQKYARRLIVYQTIEFPVNPYVGWEHSASNPESVS